MIRKNLHSLLFASTLVALGSGATAQFTVQFNQSQAVNKSVSKSYSRSVGNSYLGVTGYAYGYMRAYRADPSQMIYTGGSATLASAHARGYLRATAKILKSTRELGRFDASGNAYSTTTGNRVNGSMRLVLAGYTVVSKSFSANTTFPRFSRYLSLFPTDPRADIPVGPFTLTLKGNAGVGIENSGFALLTVDPSVGVNCTTKAWGQGRAKVEFGIFGFGVGAEAKARLAEQTLRTNLTATQTGIKGYVRWSMVALTLKLRAYAYALWGVASYSKTVLSSSYGSVTRTLFNF